MLYLVDLIELLPMQILVGQIDFQLHWEQRVLLLGNKFYQDQPPLHIDIASVVSAQLWWEASGQLGHYESVALFDISSLLVACAIGLDGLNVIGLDRYDSVPGADKEIVIKSIW